MKQKHTNYKAQYGITLKEAKEAAQKIAGHLPPCGWCITVLVEDRREVYLVNRSGSFYLQEHYKQS